MTCVHILSKLAIITFQEIDELLGQNLTEEDEDAIAAELDSLLIVSDLFHLLLGVL